MKTTVKFFSLIISTALLAGLSGCTKNLNYRKIHLHSIKTASATASVTQKNVSVHVKHFGTSDNLYYFNQRNLNCQPIQIAVENKSKSSWIISPTRISLPLTPQERVISNLQSSIGWSIGLGFSVPLVSSIIFLNLASPITGTIVGVVHGIFSYQANKIIKEDISDKMLGQDVAITPNQQKDFLVFAEKRVYSKHFTVDLINADNPKDKLAFTIDL